MKKLLTRARLIFASLLLAAGLLLPLVPARAALFQGSIEEACEGTSLNETGGDCSEKTATQTVNDTVATGIQIFGFVIGVIAVIMIIIAGVRFVTSGGDPATVNSAKNSIIYAVVGLVIALLAQVIVRFVLKKI